MNPLIAKLLISAAIKYVLPRVIDGAEELIKRRIQDRKTRVTWEGAKLGAVRREARRTQKRQARLVEKREKRIKRSLLEYRVKRIVENKKT